MTRIAEFQKKYPTIPKEVIVKWDVLNRGVRDTEGLDKISRWSRSSSATYQNYDHDVTLKEAMGNRADRVKEGFIKRPRSFYMKNGMAVALQRDSRSDYEIRELGDGKFGLFEGEEKVDIDLHFPAPPALKKDEPLTSKGNPISKFFAYPCGLSPHCFMMVPVRYCEYFNTGEQCKFCNFNATQTDAGSVGLNRAVTINLEEAVEAYKIHSSRVRLLHGLLESGGILSSQSQASIYVKFVEKLASAASYTPHINVYGEALERKSLERLKDAGLDSIAFHLEVWDRQLFEEVCPGKARHMPYDGWLQAYEEAVDVFGVGAVSCCFVGGVTLIPENGHKTWQEARDSMAEGFRWMTKTGVLPIFTNLRVPPGSIYGEDKSNHDKLPPTEFYLELTIAHTEAMMEHDLFRKMNKFMKCGLCHDGAYKGEMGMLALAGDMGNWMADQVPFEMNPKAQWLASIRSTADAQ